MRLSTLRIASAAMVAAVMLVIAPTPAASFAPPTPTFTSSRYDRQPSSQLSAKKGKGKKTSRTEGGGVGSSGGGFGAKTKSSDTKVRSVSGYTGSGTKPLAKAANTFDAIRKKHGVEACADLYARSLINDPSTFWFVGKLARRIDPDDDELTGSSVPTENEAALSQKRLILEYAKNQLRPQNLGGPYSKQLELWLAPGDSEMDVVQNKVSLRKVVGSTAKDISDGFNVADVGYNPEIYVGDEEKEGGLRVSRDDNGNPLKPVFEINAAE